MKILRGRGARGAIAVPLSALMVAMSVAVPLLERSDLGHEATVESEHDPAHCPPVHDHTICTQVGANHVVVVAGIDHRPGPSTYASSGVRSSTHLGSATTAVGPPSRAPPPATV